jgi:hypothetical protein
MAKTTTTKPISKATVQAELRRIKKERPDAVNPTRIDAFGYTSCLYHQGRGRNIKRCIIGQMAYDMGLPTPDPIAGPVDEVAYEGGVWDGLFTDAAVQFMTAVQRQADGDGDNLVPWGKVKV